MWTVSLRWLSTWSDRGRAPQHWLRRCVYLFVFIFECQHWSSLCWSVHHALISVALWKVSSQHYVNRVICFTRIFNVHSIWYALLYILIPAVALRPDDSHLPAAAVKEAAGQTCPPAPWTNSLRGLLLSAAPGNTGQTWKTTLASLYSRFDLYSCILWLSLHHFTRFLNRSLVFFQTRDALHFSEDEDAVIVGSLDFYSEYMDDCPWVAVTQRTPQGLKGQPEGSTNNKDMVWGGLDEYALIVIHNLTDELSLKNLI